MTKGEEERGMSKRGRFLAASALGTAAVSAAVLVGGSTLAPASGRVTDADVVEVASVSLSTKDAANLRYIREEEYLAHDVYTVMYRKHQRLIFSTIAASELRHTAAIEGLLDRYGIDDPADPHRLGEFTDPALQALFDELVARGKTSLRAALKVGVFIERTDLIDLADAIETAKADDVDDVLQALWNGSRNHLSAFRSQLDRL